MRKFFGVFWTQVTWSSGNRRFYVNCIFFLAISVFLPLSVSFLEIGVLWTLIYLFLCFQLVSSTLIVYFLTTGVLLPPIVIFSFLLCGLASFDSNRFFSP